MGQANAMHFSSLVGTQGDSNGGVTSGCFSRPYTQRERETFSDANCLCGLPTYRMRGSLLR